MSNRSFTHCHVHVDYSMLDGAARIDNLLAECVRMGMSALAITDHGNMFGAYELWSKARKCGINPIIGVEAYLAPQSRHARKEEPLLGGGPPIRYTHMTLLAETTEGMHNLFRLSSLASLQGFYYHPRMDRELLAQYSDGIIATTGCPGGEVPRLLQAGRFGAACQAASDYRDIFGPEHYYCELMDHGIDIERSTRADTVRLATRLRLPYLATNDSHYAQRSDAKSHDVLLCQPPGTLVRRVIPKSRVGTPRGTEFPILTEDVPIETIRVGDRVVSWSGKLRRGRIHRWGFLVSQIGIREYSDEIVGVRTDSGLTSRYTYDHKAIVRLDGQLRDGNFVVYLMRKGALFRVGVTQYRRKGRGCDLGPMYRLKEEVGDDIWVLSVHESLDNAREEEAWVGYQYNIPTWTFTKLGDRCGTRKAFYERIWDRIGSDLGDRAKACLADFDRDIRFPLLTRGAIFIVRPQIVRACNLLSGMLACTPENDTVHTYDGTGVWRPVEVFRETYSGPVYSMEVEGDHTYIADGIVTHNCVQTGARISDADRFRFEGGPEYYLKSPEQMRALFDDEFPEACDNSLHIAERVNVEFIEGRRDLMPQFKVPTEMTDSV